MNARSKLTTFCQGYLCTTAKYEKHIHDHDVVRPVQVRAQMLSGCEVVQKVIKALEHSLNREPLGGQYNSLRKVMQSFTELCKSDTQKDTILDCGGIVQLTRLCDLNTEEQHPDTMMFGCEAAWHLSFHSVGKARLCESSVLVNRLQVH